MCLWVWLFFSQCLAFPVYFYDSAQIPFTLFLFFVSVTFSADHSLCLHLVECAFYRPWLKGFSQVTALCTAGYQCWSWLIVIQAAGMDQEEQRSIIKSFSKLWLRFLFLLKNKMYSENLILTLKISWDVAINRKGKKSRLSESNVEDLGWAPLGSKSLNAACNAS